MTSATEAVGLLAAGVGAGICGSVAGLASLASFPALLATGLSPVAANVTNTVGLIGSSVGSILGSRPELRGQGPRLRELAPITLAGGAAGAALLLLTPSGGFQRIVPFLIALSAVLILVRPRLQRALVARRRRLLGVPDEEPAGQSRGQSLGQSLGQSSRQPSGQAPSAYARWAARIGIFAVGVYGGYFGAGAGVMMLALLALATGEAIVRANALKNVLLGVANATAAVGFAVFGPVHWLPAVLLGVGCVGGGYVGPAIARAVPPTLLRWLIGLAGLYLAVDLFLDAY